MLASTRNSASTQERAARVSTCGLRTSDLAPWALLLRLYFMSCGHDSSLFTRGLATCCLALVKSVAVRLCSSIDTIEVVQHAVRFNIDH